jgi:NAD(P)-dependent dehydrogenase (short-subunit alcohol dehydrogenase family)
MGTILTGSYFAPSLYGGSVVVITGGSSGLGLDMAGAFLEHGASVAICSRSPDRLQEAAAVLHRRSGRQVVAVPCDVRDERAVQSLRDIVLAELGPVDVVVNNAAGNFKVAASKMTSRAFRTVLDIDLLGTLNTTMAFVEGMMDRRQGVICSIVVPEPERGFPLFSHAGAAKAAIVSLTRSWAREWGMYGVRAVAIGPGPVPTEGAGKNMLGKQGSDIFANVAASVPLGRLGQPSDISDAALFLCSPAASWITGCLLTVDGGLYLSTVRGTVAPGE